MSRKSWPTQAMAGMHVRGRRPIRVRSLCTSALPIKLKLTKASLPYTVSALILTLHGKSLSRKITRSAKSIGLKTKKCCIRFFLVRVSSFLDMSLSGLENMLFVRIFLLLQILYCCSFSKPVGLAKPDHYCLLDIAMVD